LKWEYRIEILDPADDTFGEGFDGYVQLLNMMGQYGWELVSVAAQPGLPLMAFFKRPQAE
jgi:hypothetical protein